MESKERIIRKFKTCTVLSMVLAVLTMVLAILSLVIDWNPLLALIPAVPAILLNGLARTYREALPKKQDYGDPTARD